MLRSPHLFALLLTAASAPAHAADAMRPMQTGMVTFTVRVENVSTPTTLRSATGATAPAPNSPGVWIVHTRPGVAFRRGELDRGAGLEAQAEDGNPGPLAAALTHAEGVVERGVFDTPVGDAGPGPALPGKAYQFTFRAMPGERLTLLTMFGQSNDLFYAPSDEGIALFEHGRPISGDITSRLHLWDAGTEVNQEPGFGPDQGPRQAGPNTGPSERSVVRRIEDVKDGFTYPAVADVLRITVSASAPAIVAN